MLYKKVLPHLKFAAAKNGGTQSLSHPHYDSGFTRTKNRKICCIYFISFLSCPFISPKIHSTILPVISFHFLSFPVISPKIHPIIFLFISFHFTQNSSKIHAVMFSLISFHFLPFPFIPPTIYPKFIQFFFARFCPTTYCRG